MLADMMIENDPRWTRIVERDADADGLFWYSVRTTGVFCRPSCPSRVANPANVAIHDTIEDARASGARPCLRCDPENKAGTPAMIAAACRMIEDAEDAPSLADLAAAAGLGAGHFRRVFQRATGMTPKEYAIAHRERRARRALGSEGSVTEAIYAAGFGSAGRFYEAASSMLGMTPTAYRKGGAGETLQYAFGRSSLGEVIVASSEAGIASILLGDSREELAGQLRGRFPRATLVEGDEDYGALVATVVALVEEPGRGLDLPLDIRGTLFQRRVWTALRALPAGRTASYAEIAAAIGAQGAARAVATACAANAHAVAIPCHRVVRGDGALSGYRWGVARKRALLDRESR